MGMNTPGELFILFALGLNILTGVSFFLAGRGKASLVSLAHRSYHFFTLFAVLAFAYLYYLFFSHNYAFKYVYEYNELAQPFLYVLSGIWGGQEGTYLLWLMFNALFGYVILRWGGQYKNYGMAAFAVINMFFLLILTRLSPFALLPVAQADGLGLNPLLRDPWMVIHPPLMFVGYSVVAIPFVFAITALVKNDYSDWQVRAFPWVAFGALFLGLGNILGGFWAYKTLGWGGYWGWDPVENSSFIPWLISLALLHGLILEKKTGALKRVNLLLSAFLFLLVIYGTFLTRSGVLADFSVHSFGDLGVSNYLVGFMLFFLFASLALFAYRAAGVNSSPINYNYFGRDLSLFVGMSLLFIIGMVVLFWTSLPLLTMAFSDTPRAADVSTYNTFAMPLAVIMAFFLTLSPLMRYTDYVVKGWQSKLLITTFASAAVGFGLFYIALDASFVFGLVFTFVVTGMVMALFHSGLMKAIVPSLVAMAATIAITLVSGVRDALYIMFFASAAMTATANGIVLFQRARKGNWMYMGAHLAHFGFGVMLVGVLASSAFVSYEKIILPKGQSGDTFGVGVVYEGMENEITHPNNELRLVLSDGEEIVNARPQLYYSQRMDGIMRKPFIDRSFTRDLYFAPSQIQEAESRGIKIHKGETMEIKDFALTFHGFEMGDHGGDMSGGMSVTAKLAVESDEGSFEASPAVTSDGASGLTEHPATFAVSGQQYNVVIQRILADEGAVLLSIPEAEDGGRPEQLVMDVTFIPMINMVWSGSIMILIGMVIVFIRRKAESAIVEV